ncbi:MULTISPECIES: nucleotidyl transferase AbiEii/AbiGii toxin family protein [Streptomyces]|uniref:Nucleotidyl transferase AbiEii/AbiGii toxin family protein n=1 Tax=Streptomyces rubrogriseus TaxID=194673 RepID=A0ABT4NXX5_9ACTN|nr:MULTISPECIES: nucleotidyl transferase AbiEii/AbiGii toxin family protein [Streptomyces anthocyanicus group]MCW8118916.1 nucleotidyl transferase AbiEii/AbiGii toxin family protein [Streptomyces anthocyanicus]MCZ4633973.1 nucleotidyl transferase AbiEii/AbiGii toxin family protein [Streptomyces rubrogriseus]WTE21085.1 nucleotidyl transferase AbiEii/AbiGii toxin family protein [Streptomyces anthocyanicus]
MSRQGWQGFGWANDRVPRAPLDDETRRAEHLPRTLRPVPGDDVTQRPVFDPALKQYQNAYRATDPSFTDPERGTAWRAARRRALDQVLDAVADSEWVDSLVLRGSMLMSTWFGAQAREPGDLDFVVVPRSWRIDDGRTERMLTTLAEAAGARAGTGAGGVDVGISARGAVVEDIWTYDRVPGLRMVVPWGSPGLPGGHVQLDFVFGERLPEPPEPVELSGGAVLYAATPGLSLAWKLMWLINDMYGQGKDLYDAVLLAERHPLSRDLLHAVFRLSGEWPYHREHILLEDVVEAAGCVEWNHFVTEYPRFRDRGDEFAERLVRAVTPAFTRDGG